MTDFPEMKRALKQSPRWRRFAYSMVSVVMWTNRRRFYRQFWRWVAFLSMRGHAWAVRNAVRNMEDAR